MREWIQALEDLHDIAAADDARRNAEPIITLVEYAKREAGVHSVLIANPAPKEVDALPDQTARRVHAAIIALAANPRPPGCKKPRAQPDL